MYVLKYKEFVEHHNNLPRKLVSSNTDLTEDEKKHYFKIVFDTIKKTIAELYDIKDKGNQIVKSIWSTEETSDIINDCLGKYPQVLPQVCANKILKELEHMLNETE